MSEHSPSVYFVAAIGTDSGKTLVSAILCKALRANYWKPVQSGAAEGTDSHTVLQLLNGTDTKVFPESASFQAPLSPHHAAALEQKEILLSHISLPALAGQNLVVEGAGGLLVPLNYRPEFLVDLCKVWNAKVVLVSNHYLGSINHTLLSISELKSRGVPLYGLVFNGACYPEAERIIEQAAGCPVLLRLPRLEQVNAHSVAQMAQKCYLP